MKSAIIKKQNKLKRQHNQRRSAIDQSYDTNNNMNYDTGGVMDDVDEQKHANDENSEGADGKESSKCGVSIIITISIVTTI